MNLDSADILNVVKNDDVYKTVEVLSDRHMLGLAGKAAGYMLHDWHEESSDTHAMYLANMPIEGREYPDYCSRSCFNSLVWDGDAFDLAMRLGISIDIWPECVYATLPRLGLPIKLLGIAPYCVPLHGRTRNEAVRKAVTVVAAALGACK